MGTRRHRLVVAVRVGRAVVAGVLVAAGGFVIGASPAHAATIMPAGCTEVDLENAITAANTTAAPDTIAFPSGCSTFTLVTGGPTGLPVITSPITIQGPGAIVRDAAAPRFRLFDVASSGSLTIVDLTLRGGVAPGNGGAISNAGRLRLQSCVISDNTTAPGGTGGAGANGFGAAGISGAPGGGAGGVGGAGGGAVGGQGGNGGNGGDGGAVFSTAGSSLTVQGCTFANNTTGAGGPGGAGGRGFGGFGGNGGPGRSASPGTGGPGGTGARGTGGAGGTGGSSGVGGAIAATAPFVDISGSVFHDNATGVGGLGGAGGYGFSGFGGAGGAGGPNGGSGGPAGAADEGIGGPGGVGGDSGRGGAVVLTAASSITNSSFPQQQHRAWR